MTSALAIILGAFASFAGFLFGYDTGYISGCKEIPEFLKTFGTLNDQGVYVLTTSDDSLITSILSAGTLVGSLASPLAADYLGRRWGIILYVLIFCVGVALQTGGSDIGTFSAGRVLAGLGVGGTSCIVPLYQSECAPKKLRGLIVAAYQFFVTVGLLLASCIVYGTKNMPSRAAYQIPIGLQFVWAVIIAVGLFLLPESPRWHALKGNEPAARHALSRLLGADEESDEVRYAWAEMAASLEAERMIGQGSYKDCFTMTESKNRKRILTGMAYQALQQLTGINFFFYFGTTFFGRAGVNNPFLTTVILNIVNTVMSVPGMLLFDRLGRRTLVIYGAIGMGTSQFIVAIVGIAVSTNNVVGQKVLIAFSCIYIAHFAATWGPGTWITTSEIYPLSIRAKGLSLSTGTQWLLNFAIGYATPYLVDQGPGKADLGTNVFWIWGGFCWVGLVFAIFFIPETKNLSLEQVDLLYRNSTVLESDSYRRYLMTQNIQEDGHGEPVHVSSGKDDKPEVEHCDSV